MQRTDTKGKTSGKTDDVNAAAKADAAAYSVDEMQNLVTTIWTEVLDCGPLDPETTFFEAGGSSGLLSEVQEKLESRLGLTLDFTLFFEAAKLADLAARLADLASVKPEPVKTVKRNDAKDQGDSAIAIIGMAGRIPGATSLDAFWASIRSGENLIPTFSQDELEDQIDPETRSAKAYVPARTVLQDADKFDAKFFDILPAEAKIMDPQARVFLEICAEALEAAGIDPSRTDAPIAVYAGATFSTYLLANLMQDRAALEEFTSTFQIGNYTMMTGNTNDSLAGRVAYKLGLKGPAVAVSTACSTSLTAIAQACQCLRAGQADAALAGGVSITFPQKRGYLSQEGGMVAPDGICRPFDVKAGGTVFGHGAGVVVLKRLADALADGDHIQAVIRGVGISNDGSDKFSYTAPSATGQAKAIRMAHQEAGVSPDSISFVECHGTATPLGDPIEIKGLTQAFGGGVARTCALGSVKGNIGHLATAAGVMGVIKTVLMLTHREIPPVANFTAPNPKIDFAGGPFHVPASVSDWSATGPRRAGVSSTGIGGTNVHLVLEEAPEQADETATKSVQILPLSAKSPEALDEMRENLAKALTAPDAPPLADIALTLQEGRRVFPYRAAVAALDHAKAATALRAMRKPAVKVAAGKPPIIFLFPGQGSQYPGMGSGLYRNQPVYTKWIDQGAEILKPLLDFDLRDILCGADLSDKTAARALRDTRLTQPALYLTQYATAQLWNARGIKPDLLIGHSVGEFAAAALSGVFDFETGLAMIAARGQLMQDQQPGSMLAVMAKLDALTPHLTAEIDIAAMNAPSLQVVAGSEAAIDALAGRLTQAGLNSTKLHTSHAFHSAMMDPVVPELEKLIRAHKLNAPEIPILSTVSAEIMQPETARDPAYWAGQARAPVNFQAALQAACQTGSEVFVEVGAGRTLSTFAAQILERSSRGRVFHSLPDHTPSVDDESAMAAALANLWCLGVPVDWAKAGPRGTRKVSLPTYAFQRQSFWVEPVSSKDAFMPLTQTANASSAQPDPAVVPTPSAPADKARGVRVQADLLAQFADLSGVDLHASDATETFLDLGFDSLFLAQASKAVAAKFAVELTFRSLLSEHTSIAALAAHLDKILPPEAVPAVPVAAAPVAGPVQAPQPAQSAPSAPKNADFEGLVKAQMDTMQRVFAEQMRALAVLQSGVPVAPRDPAAAPVQAVAPTLADHNITPLFAPTQPQPTPDIMGQPVPLTPSQREIWMAHQNGNASACCFNQSVSLHLRGALDIDILRRSLNRLVARHDALRMVFDRGGKTFHVEPTKELNLPVHNLSDQPDPKAALAEMLRADAKTPVDIVNDRPIRAMLIQTGANEHVLVLTLHHIACDGWSYNVMFPELAADYSASLAGQHADLPNAPSFVDFAHQLAAMKAKPETLAYWKDQYQTLPSLPELPTDHPRPARRGYKGDTVSAFMDAEALVNLRKTGAQMGCTLFATLFGGLALTLGKLSGANDLVLGVPFGSRGSDKFRKLVGHCVNFLPIRANVDTALPVKTYLSAIGSTVLDAFEHEQTTYGTLLDQLNVPRDVNRLPLTEVMFNLRREDAGVQIDGLDCALSPNPKAAVNFDLFFNVIESRRGLRIDVDYNSEIFTAETIKRWIGHLQNVLAEMVRDSDQPLREISLMTAEDLTGLVNANKATARDYDTTRSVLEHIEMRRQETPRAVAVEDGTSALTYDDLARQSDALAATLQARLPVPGQRVAVAVQRSTDMLVALLGVLKAGHAYVPLDPRQPAERLRTILTTAQVAGIVSSSDEAPEFARNLDLVCVGARQTAKAAPTPVVCDPEATAYVIFTSGSTGTPKGVEIPHRAFLNFLLSMAEQPGFNARDTLLSVTTVMFDIAALELFLPLISGGKVVIAPTEDVLDGFRLVKRLAKGDITVMQATPTLWDMLLEVGLKPGVGMKVLTGGEPLPEDLAARLTAHGAEVWNMYGPTETTIWSAVKRLDGTTPITIGHPIANTDLYVLDGDDQPVPAGVAGELNIGGLGLAKGYFGQPDLTATAFRTAHIAGTPTLLYRTGDLARRLANGEIQVLGRKDTQVKLRGFRIELGEIETRLRAMPEVEKVAVDLKKRSNGVSQLVAYLVPATNVTLDTQVLAQRLADQLPDYMVPQGWVSLSALPQTANGKLDRKALPHPDQKAKVAPIRAKTEASGTTEEHLLRIWCAVLGTDQISTTDSLYALGVDSLMIFKIAARMLDEGLDLEARDLMAHPTIRELAAFADKRTETGAAPSRPSLKSFLRGAQRSQEIAS